MALLLEKFWKAQVSLWPPADVRYYLNGLLFETSQKKINLVATDGHRLAWGSYDHNEDLEDKKIIIPRSTAMELQRILIFFLKKFLSLPTTLN
jgi:DNA polymerase III sliding clamp (beta) subunit (PCNA family)